MRERIRDIDRLKHIDECIGHVIDFCYTFCFLKLLCPRRRLAERIEAALCPYRRLAERVEAVLYLRRRLAERTVLTYNCNLAICSTMPSGIAFSFFPLTSKFISRWKLSSCSCVRS